jgi:hypothetical protein
MHVKPVALSSRTRQRGQALAFFGIGMLAFVALAVIGVDVGRLAFTAAEVQSIADAAATAGAGALADHRPNPLGDATSVVGQNYVDARTGTVGGATTDVIKSITPGVWDSTSQTFAASSWTDPNANAVRARGVATVDNLVAAAIGVMTSDVERQATAVAGGACTEVAALPIAIEQDAIQQFLDSPDCRSIPETQLFQVPGDNSCFTSLSQSAASAAEERAHIPAACQGPGGNTGGGQTATLSIGDPIRLNNGSDGSVLKTFEGCLSADPQLREFVVPVIAANSCCGGCSQNVVSFARIIISEVRQTGPAAQKGVYITGVCREALTGTNPGCNTAGENAVAIVK